jgi:uncharacterized membrane protein
MVVNVVMLVGGIILIILSALVIFLGGALLAMGITVDLDTETPKERRNYFISSIIIIVIGIAVNTTGWMAIRESHIRLKFINTEKNKEETTTENTTENTTEVTRIVINGETYILQNKED